MTPEQQVTLKAYILADPAMPAEAAVGRLLQIVGMVPLTKPRHVEWAMADEGVAS